ncbi:hypothetical protein GGR52DRAFT_558211, partial [Hypoxylon sp. FL1284]
MFRATRYFFLVYVTEYAGEDAGTGISCCTCQTWGREGVPGATRRAGRAGRAGRWDRCGTVRQLRRMVGFTPPSVCFVSCMIHRYVGHSTTLTSTSPRDLHALRTDVLVLVPYRPTSLGSYSLGQEIFPVESSAAAYWIWRGALRCRDNADSRLPLYPRPLIGMASSEVDFRLARLARLWLASFWRRYGLIPDRTWTSRRELVLFSFGTSSTKSKLLLWPSALAGSGEGVSLSKGLLFFIVDLFS